MNYLFSGENYFHWIDCLSNQMNKNIHSLLAHIKRHRLRFQFQNWFILFNFFYPISMLVLKNQLLLPITIYISIHLSFRNSTLSKISISNICFILSLSVCMYICESQYTKLRLRVRRKNKPLCTTSNPKVESINSSIKTIHSFHTQSINSDQENEKWQHEVNFQKSNSNQLYWFTSKSKTLWLVIKKIHHFSTKLIE